MDKANTARNIEIKTTTESKPNTQDKHQSQEKKNNINYIYNNNIIIRDTEPGVFTEPEQDALLEAYTRNVAPQMSYQVAAFLEQLHKEGMTVDVMIRAMELTAWAQRPSPAYLRAVLTSWRKGVRDMTNIQGKPGAKWWQKTLLKATTDHNTQAPEPDPWDKDDDLPF